MGRQLEHQGGREEVSPAFINPASQQGGGGRLTPGWRSLGEDGGARRSQQKTFGFQKVKVESKSFVKIINLVDCVLGLLSVLDTALRAKVLANK